MDSFSKADLVKNGRETMKGFLIVVFWLAIFLIVTTPPTIIILRLLKDVARTTNDNYIEAFCSLLSIYLFGFVYLGLPMAMASAGFYLWGTKFPKSKWHKTLVIFRDTLHPSSFVLYAETVATELNRRQDYDSPIQFIIDQYDPKPIQVIGYILLSASMWPFRAMLSGGYVSVILLVALVCIVLAITVCILKAICFLICLPFKPFTTTQKNQPQSCNSKS